MPLPLQRRDREGIYPCVFYFILVALAIFSPFQLFTLSPLSCLQFVTFTVVKKSDATLRECPRNLPTGSWLVKLQGFGSLVFR